MREFYSSGLTVEHPMRARSLYPVSNMGWSGRSPAYRPVGIDLGSRQKALQGRAPRLGDLPSVEKIGGAIAFIAGGSAGFYVSDILPPPESVILKALGVIAVGWGIYSLYSTVSSPKTPDPNASAGQTAPTVTADQFALVDGSIISPLSGTRPDKNSWWSLTPSFDVKVLLSNGSGKDVNLSYDILANISSGPGLPIDGKTWISKEVYRSNADIPASGTTTLTVSVPVVKPPQEGTMVNPGQSTSGYFGTPVVGPSVVYMDLQLRKFDAGGNAVPIGNSVHLGPWGWKEII